MCFYSRRCSSPVKGTTWAWQIYEINGSLSSQDAVSEEVSVGISTPKPQPKVWGRINLDNYVDANVDHVHFHKKIAEGHHEEDVLSEIRISKTIPDCMNDFASLVDLDLPADIQSCDAIRASSEKYCDQPEVRLACCASCEEYDREKSVDMCPLLRGKQIEDVSSEVWAIANDAISCGFDKDCGTHCVRPNLEC